MILLYHTCPGVSVRVLLEDTGRGIGRLSVEDGSSACLGTIQSTRGGNRTRGS